MCINVVQDYNLRKRSEHLLKSMMLDGRAISVTDPKSYSQRFRNFLGALFCSKQFK